MALAELATGAAIGLSLAVPPGPVNALIAREAAAGGTWAGARAGLPAPILDTCWLVLVVLGLPRVIDLAAALPWMAGAGALLMAWLAIDTVRIRDAPPPLSGPWAVWGVTLTNPFQYAWWASAGAVLMAKAGPWGAVGFVAAVFAWVPVLAALVAHGARRWTWFTPAVTLLSADALAIFSVQLAVEGLRGAGVA